MVKLWKRIRVKTAFRKTNKAKVKMTSALRQPYIEYFDESIKSAVIDPWIIIMIVITALQSLVLWIFHYQCKAAFILHRLT